jgi:hypothetical protein
MCFPLIFEGKKKILWIFNKIIKEKKKQRKKKIFFVKET